MKQGINIHMPVRFDGIDLADVAQIEFTFKKTNCRNAEAVKTAVWKADGTGDCVRKPETDDIILVPWTRAETYLFCGSFFMDTRITLNGSTDNPPTNIVALEMGATLFEESD